VPVRSNPEPTKAAASETSVVGAEPAGLGAQRDDHQQQGRRGCVEGEQRSMGQSETTGVKLELAPVSAPLGRTPGDPAFEP